MSRRWATGDIVVAATPPAAGPLVVKFGGSLFARASWPQDLRDLLQQVTERPDRCLVVVGGGPLVDGLRRIDAASPQPARLMHDLAIACMGTTAEVVATALALPRVADPMDLEAGAIAILDPVRWFAACPLGRELPVGWQVTSDSIAARIAGERGRLLLAKSTPPPAHTLAAVDPLRALSASGWVDDHFPTVAVGLAAVSWAAPS